MNRAQRTTLALDTLRIVESGHYNTASGQSVSIAAATAQCRDHTRLFMPDELQQIAADLPLSGERIDTRFDVANETTLMGARRLATATTERVGVLNFASARNPGGGFLTGSQAQEESLARTSSLHASLTSDAATPFYEFHRREASALYSDRMILSPDCPVFRDDEGGLLPSPYNITLLTSPAPNARALRENDQQALPQLAAVLSQRAGRVLALALHAGCRHLVLGAWGCGVFGNDPTLVARIFAQHLAGARLGGKFNNVRFSVLDDSPGELTLAAFRHEFA